LPSVSVILPAHNEAENLEEVINGLVPELLKNTSGFEIIIVDDGSEDATGELAADFSRKDDRIRLIKHETNRGYGAALRTGFDNARLEWLFFMDSDGQFVPAEIADLIKLTKDGEFIAGERTNRRDPLHRRIYGRLFSLSMRALFGVRVRDVNCAFKLFKKSLLDNWSFISTGALINTEILLCARQKGVDPLQVPVTHLPRKAGENSGGTPRVIGRAGGEAFRLLLRKYASF